jgi:hypothetical protein
MHTYLALAAGHAHGHLSAGASAAIVAAVVAAVIIAALKGIARILSPRKPKTATATAKRR